MPYFRFGLERSQVLRDHAAMTFVRRRLGAEQTDRIFLQQLSRFGFGTPFRQQLVEPFFVTRPVAIFLVSVEQFVGRREFGMMLVSYPEPLFEQVSEIRLLAPARELRSVAQTHVNDALHARAA